MRFAVPVLLLAAVPGTAAIAAPRAHAAADWTRVAVVTPEGGVRIGNPQAKAALVEYGSFTCPHCAAFAKEAFSPIVDRYVRTGRLSFEFRAALRDKADLVAALTARCGGPGRFFPTAEALFAAQKDWFGRAVTLDQTSPIDVSGADPAPGLTKLADGSGIAAIGIKAGVPQAQLARCYADKSLFASIQKAADDAWNVRQIGGTPAFYLNGDKLDDVYGWAALEPHLRAATHG